MNALFRLVIATLVVSLPASTLAQGLILNEYNAVASNEFLNGNSSIGDDKSDDRDTFFGRIESNGGNWLELVVVEDHLDIRGWELRWLELDGDGNGNVNDIAIWDPTRVNGNVSQGQIMFSPVADLWSDLRSGTIITIIEKDSINEIIEAPNPDDDPIDTLFDFDTSTDAGYNPAGDDWEILVSTRDEVGKPSPLITTLTNVDGDGPGDFSIGSDNWELRIFDGTMDVFGPVGEAIEFGIPLDTFGGVNDKEIVRLEADPSASVMLSDYDDEDRSTFGSPNEYSAGPQDFSVLRSVIGDDVVGDTNGDRVVDTDDLKDVRDNFGATGPDDGTLAGDTFPFDGTVNIKDLNGVRNNFGAGSMAVPEPAGALLAVIGCLLMLTVSRPIRRSRS